ncbi:MAG: hypothetical protein ABJA87_05280 [bacterium]
MSPDSQTAVITDRNDVHNTNVDEAIAAEGFCGTINLRTGRTCLLPAQHVGPCELQRREQ